MERIIRILKTIFSAPFIVILLVIAIPLAAISSLIDIPLRSRRLRHINKEIVDLWLPNRKYIYIRYQSESKLAYFVDEIVRKHEHIYTERWSKDESKWINNWPKLDKTSSHDLS